MVTAAAPARISTATSNNPGRDRGRLVGSPTAPARAATLRARPIPVAAYPAGVPRWVTYGGRRQRVLTVHEQPRDPRLPSVPYGAHAMQVELADGHVLTLLHQRGGWYEREG